MTAVYPHPTALLVRLGGLRYSLRKKDYRLYSAKFARPNPDPAVVQYLKERSSEPWGISALVAYEFVSFYPQSQRREKLRQLEQDILNEISPIDAQTSLEAANLRSLLENAGTSLDTGDLLVAAIARQHSGTLATANKNDFDKQLIHELLDVDIVPTTK